MVELFHSAEEVGDYVSARMALITIDNGAETNIGIRHFKGRKNIDDPQMPCSVLLEGTDTIEGKAGRTMVDVKLRQRYVLIGYDVCDPNNPNEKAHAMLRDMKKCIFNDQPNFGGRVLEVTYAGRDIGPRIDGNSSVMAVVEIDVVYAEKLSSP